MSLNFAKRSKKGKMTLKRHAMQEHDNLIMAEEALHWVAEVNEEMPLSVSDFFIWIENGAALCDLMLKLSKQAGIELPKIKFKPDAAAQSFSARENVIHFLNCCKAIGVPEVLLFEVDDLVLHRNHNSISQLLLELKAILELQTAQKHAMDSDEVRRQREDAGVQLRKAIQAEPRRRRMKSEDFVPAPDVAEAAQQPPPPDPIPEDPKGTKVENLAVGINSDDPVTLLHSVRTFRRLLSIEQNPPIQEVIDAGVVPSFVKLLKMTDNFTIQFEAAWAITNIASGISSHTQVLIKSGAIPALVQLLRSPNKDVQEQAVWALGNIAGDSPASRNLVLDAKAMEPLLALCSGQPRLSMLRNSTWTISNLCRGQPQPKFELVYPALPTLANLIFSKDEEVLIDACWALSYLCDDTGADNSKIEAVIRAGTIPRVVELLLDPSNSVRAPALRTVGNIVTGDDAQTQVVIGCGCLTSLLAQLSNAHRGIRKEACWAISNITAGNREQIQAVINANIIPALVYLLKNADFDIKKEAAWGISNTTSGGSFDQTRYIVSQGVIPPLCELFGCNHASIIAVALEAIENILTVGEKDKETNKGVNKYAEMVEECGGLEKLERLRNCANPDLYKKVVKMLGDFFKV